MNITNLQGYPLYAIGIYDITSNHFYFLQKIPMLDYSWLKEVLRKHIRIILGENRNPNLNISYKTFVHFSDNYITKYIRACSTIINEVMLVILYNTAIDVYQMRVINQRIINSLVFLCKTKELMIEMLMKKYNDVFTLLSDSLAMINSGMRLKYIQMEDIICKHVLMHQHVFFSVKTKWEIVEVFHSYASKKDYENTKNTLEQRKELRKLLMQKQSVYTTSNNNCNRFPLNECIKKHNASLMQKLYQKYNFLSLDDNCGITGRERIFQSIPFRFGGTEPNQMPSTNLTSTQGCIPLSQSCGQNFGHFIDFGLLAKSIKMNNNSSLQSREVIMSKSTIQDETIISKIQKMRSEEISHERRNMNMYGLSMSPPKKVLSGFKPQEMEIVGSEIAIGSDRSFPQKKKDSSQVNQILDSEIDIGTVQHLNKVVLNYSQTFQKNSRGSANPSLFQKMAKEKMINSARDCFNIPMNNPISHRTLSQPIIDLSIEEMQTNTTSVDASSNQGKTLNLPEFWEIQEQKKINLFDFSPLEKSLTELKKEDKFDPLTIKTHLRGAITEKGNLKYLRGNLEKMEFKGQISLELKNNFEIQNKLFNVKIFSDNWTNEKAFPQKDYDQTNVEVLNTSSNLRVSCKNARTFFKIISYRINPGLMEAVVDIKLKKEFSQEQNRLKCELGFELNKKYNNKVKICQLEVEFSLKPGIKYTIYKASIKEYTVNTDKTVIKYILPNLVRGIGMIFEVGEGDLLNGIKVSYQCQDWTPSGIIIDVTYLDEGKMINHLAIVKRCLIETEYTL